MKKLLYILVVFVFSFHPCYTQNTDSLWKIYNNKSQADTTRIKAINNIAVFYQSIKPDTAIFLAGKELNLVNTLPLQKAKKWAAGVFYIMGESYVNKGDYPKALEEYLKSLQEYEETGNKRFVGNCLHSIGNVYWYQSNFPKAVDYYLKALKVEEEIGNREGIGNSLNNIGIIYLYQSDYAKALEYYLKALKIYEERGDKKGIGACYINIGTVYSEQEKHDYPKALEYFLQAIPILEEINDKEYIGNCYANIGSVYEHLFNYRTALEYHVKSLQAKRKIADKQGMAIALSNIGQVYSDLLNYKMAIKYGDSSLQISKEIGDINTQRVAFQNMATAYSKTGRYKEAYEYHVKFKALTDSIYNADNSKQLGDMKIRFEVERKETELKIKSDAEQEKLKVVSYEEKKRQWVIIGAVFGVLILVVIFSFSLYKRFKVTQRQKEVIEEQKNLVDEAYKELHQKNKEVMDSIHYAKKIQTALITPEKYIENSLNKLHKKIKKSMKAFKLINIDGGKCSFLEGSIPQNEHIDVTHFFAQSQIEKYQLSAHPAPRYQFVLTLKGKLKFTVSNGESFIIEPGIILVAKDIHGEGHTWEIIEGDEWHRIYIVPHTDAEDHFIPNN